MPEEKKPIWLVSLIAKINSLAEEVGLDDDGVSRFREFVVTTAKSQYVAGNNAGIYWARHGKNKAAGA